VVEGQVVYYVPGSLEVAIMCDLCSGSGSHDNWVLNLAGEPSREKTWGLEYVIGEQSDNGKICISPSGNSLTISISKMDRHGKDASAYVTSMAGHRMHVVWDGGMAAYVMNNPMVDEAQQHCMLGIAREYRH
jgi:hypothetical protein